MGNLQKFTTTEKMSQAVVWAIVRENHSFLIKSRKSGGIQFSKHPANLKNKNTLKSSGIANSKPISIQGSADGITMKSGKTVATWGKHRGQRMTVLKVGNAVGKMNPALRGAAENESLLFSDARPSK